MQNFHYIFPLYEIWSPVTCVSAMCKHRQKNNGITTTIYIIIKHRYQRIKVVDIFFTEKGIPITNCKACVTDGAPAIIGRFGHQRGFIAHLKYAILGILTVIVSFIVNI